MNARARRAALTLLVLATLLGGCAAPSWTFTGLPLRGPHHRITAVFADALNLPAGAHVRVDGDDVGRVEEITAADYTARVRLAVRDDVRLPVGTTAELRRATPLGEVFVALHPPRDADPAAPVLADGAVVERDATASAPGVEDLLGALSALVGGGGLARTPTIVRELDTALDGRAAAVGDLLRQATTTAATLEEHTADVDRALDATVRLTTVLNDRRGSVDAAFRDLPPAIGVLADQTGRFADALGAAGNLSGTGSRILDASGGDLRALLRDAGPVTRGFADIGDRLSPSLRTIVEFGKGVEDATKGEYLAGTSDQPAPQVTGPDGNAPPPGPADLSDGGQAFLEHLARTVGGGDR